MKHHPSAYSPFTQPLGALTCQEAGAPGCARLGAAASSRASKLSQRLGRSQRFEPAESRRSVALALVGLVLNLSLGWFAVPGARGQGTVALTFRVASGSRLQTVHIWGPSSTAPTLSLIGSGSNDTPTPGTVPFRQSGMTIIGEGASGGLAIGDGRFKMGYQTTLFQLLGVDATSSALMPESALVPVGQCVTFRTGTSLGSIAAVTDTLSANPPGPPGISGSGIAFASFEMVMWDNSSGLYSTWAQASNAWLNGQIAAVKSPEFQVSAIGGGLNPPPYLNNMYPFQSMNLYYKLGAPVIVSDPTSQTVPAGQSATFTVSATGAGTLSYQWRFNGTDRSGATGSSLTIPSVQANDKGSYCAVVANAQGSATSGVAVLTVLLPSVIGGGAGHTVALGADGKVWAWGQNGVGQLGDGTTTDRHSPVRVSGLSNVVGIAAGRLHTVALKSNGTVWAWGYNFDGELGDGTIDTRYSPVQVSGLSGVIAIAAIGNGYFTVALKADGTVWAWGDNSYGQLGDGTTTKRLNAVQVSGLSGVIAISGGFVHTLALKADGTVWAWGNNGYGQLGDGTTTERHSPVQVSGLSGVGGIGAGYRHSVACRSDGTAWAWGYNLYGQVGDGTTTTRSNAVQVSGLSGVSAVAAGQYHTVALKSNGQVWACGYNNYGQLGDGTTTQRLTPVQTSVATGLTGASAIAAGINHNVALKTDGTIWTWGYNANGQLGDGTTTSRSSPVMVSGLSRFGITSFEMLAGPKAVVAFGSLDGAVHYFQRRTNAVTGTWTTLQTNIPGTGGILRLTNTLTTESPELYYRVGAAGL
jgi:alpha-tubulin suppressor-like RCC1 family protein